MIEIIPSDYHKVMPIFQAIKHSRAIVYALLEGNSPGRVFVDDANTPTTCLLWVEGAFFYVQGDLHNENLSNHLTSLIFDEILPGIDEQELVLFAFSDAWRSKLDTVFASKGAIRIQRKMFRFDTQRFITQRTRNGGVPAGYTLRPIDSRLAEIYSDFRPIVDPKSRRFGVCLYHGDEIACECTAVFVGGGEAEIDIHTQEKYQGKGFATITACAFIDTCLEKNFRPNWSCWPERQASIALAQKLGFTGLADVPALLWVPELDPKN